MTLPSHLLDGPDLLRSVLSGGRSTYHSQLGSRDDQPEVFCTTYYVRPQLASWMVSGAGGWPPRLLCGPDRVSWIRPRSVGLCAPLRVENRSPFNNCSRIVPFLDSTEPFSQGGPGLDRERRHVEMFQPVSELDGMNSGPLSERIGVGIPRPRTRSAPIKRTSCERIRRATTEATHSRVDSSSIFKIRHGRPARTLGAPRILNQHRGQDVHPT